MISTEEIKKLADLARIELKEEEIEKMRGEIGPVLDYVGQIKSVSGETGDKIEFGQIHNVLREDILPTESGIYNNDLVAGFPEKEAGFLKVKKIL